MAVPNLSVLLVRWMSARCASNERCTGDSRTHLDDSIRDMGGFL